MRRRRCTERAVDGPTITGRMDRTKPIRCRVRARRTKRQGPRSTTGNDVNGSYSHHETTSSGDTDSEGAGSYDTDSEPAGTATQGESDAGITCRRDFEFRPVDRTAIASRPATANTSSKPPRAAPPPHRARRRTTITPTVRATAAVTPTSAPTIKPRTRRATAPPTTSPAATASIRYRTSR